MWLGVGSMYDLCADHPRPQIAATGIAGVIPVMTVLTE
jgi:hypothetical protein